MSKKYLILPGNDDQNRGDQALVWEAKRLGEESGCIGEYYMFANPSLSKQSALHGIKSIEGILLHPSRVFNEHNNLSYSASVMIKWGSVALLDYLYSKLFLFPIVGRFVRLLSSKRVKKAYSIIRDSELIFVKGGGFIHANGELTAYYRNYYMLFHIIVAKKLKKKVVFLPNSFGPFEGFGVKGLVKRVLRKVDIIYCRESLSKDMLKTNLGIESELKPDLGFFLKPKRVDISSFLDKKKNNVALTVRPYRFPGDNNATQLYKEFIESYKGFVIWLINNNYNPVFVEQVYSENLHEQDITSISEIKALLNKEGYDVRIIANREYDCEELKGIYGQFDYTVGTRFHSVIFSLSSNVPSIAITYGGNKGIGIMKDLGLIEYSIPIDNVSLSEMVDRFLKLVTFDFKFDKESWLLAERKKMIEDIKAIRHENTNTH